MSRRDQAYWQRLRKDRRSNLAVIFGIVAGLVSLVALIGLLIPGSQAASRGSPLYWALLIPFAWWGSSLGGFEPRAMRLFTPSLLLWPFVAAASLAKAWSDGEGSTAWVIALIACSACSIGAAWLYRGSVLQREGPAR